MTIVPRSKLTLAPRAISILRSTLTSSMSGKVLDGAGIHRIKGGRYDGDRRILAAADHDFAGKGFPSAYDDLLFQLPSPDRSGSPPCGLIRIPPGCEKPPSDGRSGAPRGADRMNPLRKKYNVT
jgi:hypothetical protein